MDAGLCGHCTHAHLNHTRRGTSYLRCLLSRTDPRFARYPQLPVLRCAGFVPAAAGSAERQPGAGDE